MLRRKSDQHPRSVRRNVDVLIRSPSDQRVEQSKERPVTRESTVTSTHGVECMHQSDARLCRQEQVDQPPPDLEHDVRILSPADADGVEVAGEEKER